MSLHWRPDRGITFPMKSDAQLCLTNEIDTRAAADSFGERLTTSPIFPYLADPVRGESVKARFWKHVARGGADECWDWTGSRKGKGLYGQFMIASKNSRRSNRVAWAIENNRDPGDLVIRHTCDRPICCNPRHLIAGTHTDNMSDMVIRRRSWAQPTSKNGRATVASLLRDNERLRTVLQTIASFSADGDVVSLRQIAHDALHPRSMTACPIAHLNTIAHGGVA